MHYREELGRIGYDLYVIKYVNDNYILIKYDDYTEEVSMITRGSYEDCKEKFEEIWNDCNKEDL